MSSAGTNSSMSALAVGAAVGALGMQAARRMSSSSLNNTTTAFGVDEQQTRARQPQTHPSTSSNKNVGILAIEVYTPSTYVSQSELEEHSGVSKGKYTLGLGQDGLGITGDAEDVNSLSLTVVHSLLEK